MLSLPHGVQANSNQGQGRHNVEQTLTACLVIASWSLQYITALGDEYPSVHGQLQHFGDVKIHHTAPMQVLVYLWLY